MTHDGLTSSFDRKHMVEQASFVSRELGISLVALLIVFTCGWIYSAVEAISRGEAPVVARGIGTGGAHVNADGDGAGSQTALAAWLERFNPLESFEDALLNEV